MSGIWHSAGSMSLATLLQPWLPSAVLPASLLSHCCRISAPSSMFPASTIDLTTAESKGVGQQQGPQTPRSPPPSHLKMTSTAPLAPITAIWPVGHDRFTSPCRCCGVMERAAPSVPTNLENGPISTGAGSQVGSLACHNPTPH